MTPPSLCKNVEPGTKKNRAKQRKMSVKTEKRNEQEKEYRK